MAKRDFPPAKKKAKVQQLTGKALRSKIESLAPTTKKVPFAQFGCVLHRVHKPVPNRVELHHRFPLYLQAKVWQDVDPGKPATAHDKERIAVCEGGHSDVHIALNAMLLGAPKPRAIGSAERREAKVSADRYGNAQITEAPVPMETIAQVTESPAVDGV